MVGVLFILQTWIATDLAQGMKFAAPETAFFEVAERAGGAWLRTICLGAVVVAAGVANAMAAQAAVSRILYAMARDGKLPAVLAKVHPRYRTPYVSTLVVAGVSLLVGLCFAKHVDQLSRIVNFGALTGFLLLHVAVISHYLVRGRSRDWLRHLLMPLGGLLVIGYVLYEMDAAAKIMGACWIVIGLAYFLVLKFMLRRSAALDL